MVLVSDKSLRGSAFSFNPLQCNILPLSKARDKYATVANQAG